MPSRISTAVALLTAAIMLLQPGPAASQRAGGARGSSQAQRQFVEVPATAALLDNLRAGGFVLYMRHGATDYSRLDRIPAVDLMDCATQRPLSEEGRRTAAAVGASIRRAMIPVGDVHISPLCRMRDTASAAFPGHAVIVDEMLMYSANITDEEKVPVLARTRALLSAPVAAGTNRVIVGHAPNLMDLVGYFLDEALVAIFRPRGNGGFEYVASIPVDLWPSLLGGR